MTGERYVTLETAIVLKSKGFQWAHLVFGTIDIKDKKPTLMSEKGNAKPPFYNTCYNDEGKPITPKIYNPNNDHYPRPTLAMAMDWMQENHYIFIHIDCFQNEKYEWQFSGVARNLKTNYTYWETNHYGSIVNDVKEKILIETLYMLNR